jgi:ABC-type transporter Mla subunit MlaD
MLHNTVGLDVCFFKVLRSIKGRWGVEVQTNHLESIVLQIGEAVLATTETVDKLAVQVDTLTSQVQQQGYQIFALSDAVQTLAENHDSALERLRQLTETLQNLVAAIESGEG